MITLLTVVEISAKYYDFLKKEFFVVDNYFKVQIRTLIQRCNHLLDLILNK